MHVLTFNGVRLLKKRHIGKKVNDWLKVKKRCYFAFIAQKVKQKGQVDWNYKNGITCDRTTEHVFVVLCCISQSPNRRRSLKSYEWFAGVASCHHRDIRNCRGIAQYCCDLKRLKAKIQVNKFWNSAMRKPYISTGYTLSC